MSVDPVLLKGKENLLIENMVVTMKIDEDGNIIGVELPITVIQEIAECEPNVKGNSASVSGKKATTDRGLDLSVPFFVEVGDKIKIDTRTGEYIERV